jgi:hypothetical protein
MSSISRSPALPYISTFFGFMFLGFGATYMMYPRVGYSLYGFASSPTTPEDHEVMDRIMVLYGAKDVFLAAAILASTWFGTRRSAGLILMAAAVCAAVDGYVVGEEAGTNSWNHWGYGSVMGIVGAFMADLVG